MTLVSKPALEEYARQCTEQRRHYEHSLRQSHQKGSPQEAMQPEIVIQEAEEYVCIQTDSIGPCTEPSCMIELLGLPTDPLGWDESGSVLDETREADAEAPQCQHSDTENPHPSEMNSTSKGACFINYGAP